MTALESLKAWVDSHSLTSRVASAVVGIPLIGAAIWLGSPWMSFLVGGLAALGAWEVCGIAVTAGRRAAKPVAVGSSVALVALAHFVSAGSETDVGVAPAIVIVLLVYLGWQVRRTSSDDGATDWAVTAGAAVYTGGLLAHAVLLRELDQGRWWVLCVVLVTFASDTIAYGGGRLVGRTPLAPTISPRKTWEGAVAGFAVAVVAAPALTASLGVNVSVAAMAFLGAALGIVGQLGDLLESRLKRAAGVTDSGWVVPGHGGIMDRLDSIVLNVAVMYYFVVWVVQ